MQRYIEKQLFLLSARHAFTAFYFLVIPFIIKDLFKSTPLLMVMIALFIIHHLVTSIVWFYKSRNIRKRQSGDLTKRGHLVVQIVQRLEQLMMLGFVMLLISGWMQGDIVTLSFTIFLFIVVFLQHIQFYYVQYFFKSSGWFTYVLSLQKARPSYIVRERRALKNS
ncbi:MULTISPECIES: hypothetical protein [Bacillus]|uniref:hypothetical protein n=1 Tax=Bacillus TaxID=1386 RepID=UPI000626063D|nr:MULTISPECIES: hypothetical protein [Bacillus]MCA1020243.1 hypothetical protein [Bacillus stratosphericus]APP14275.1 hypothetical protein BS467_00255 [Bacillus altitudinis]KKK08857.1 hypothetical protein UF15_15190 [Bacillus sp. L_1B0_12]MBG9904574.1 hypothetical protein [Bacillus altitudinis]MBL7244739.1 hypothetical protein [Bacillus altitudinis]